MITPEEFAATPSISEPQLSHDAFWVVYTVGPSLKDDDHAKSALWLAETSVAGSARQITPGTYHDYGAQFHPQRHEIFFLSDRHQIGKAARIYRLSLEAAAGEAVPITPLANTKGIISFSISPDGHHIAFVSGDEPSEEKDSKSSDVETWGTKKDLGRLRVIDLRDPTLAVKTIVSEDAHVSTFAWSPDGAQILVRLARSADASSFCFPAVERTVPVLPSPKPIDVSFEHPYAPSGLPLWTERGDIYFVKGTNPQSPVTSYTFWKYNVLASSAHLPISFGDTTASTLKSAGSKSVALAIESSLDTRIEILDLEGKHFTAFETDNDAIHGWDARQTSSGQYVFAAIRSSGVRGEPEEVWAGSTSDGEKGRLSIQLSSHNRWCQGKTLPISEPFQWTSSDGAVIDGVISYPAGSKPQNLPTVVVPHGGPYSRDVLGLQFVFYFWRHFLASHGYLVLSPNYRGSSGRGEAFAAAARGGMGTLDWDDVDSMVTAAIERGLADAGHLGIAGYSQGGFLAAWGCTRPHSRFKAGVVGAAVTDWGSQAVTSDLPDYVAALCGGAPWNSPASMRGSSLRDVANVTAPLLIVHGLDDPRVPSTQAKALMYGIEREAPGVAGRCRLVMYPQEGHIFEKRAHVEDMCRQVLEHLDAYLK